MQVTNVTPNVFKIVSGISDTPAAVLDAVATILLQRGWTHDDTKPNPYAFKKGMVVFTQPNKYVEFVIAETGCQVVVEGVDMISSSPTYNQRLRAYDPLHDLNDKGFRGLDTVNLVNTTVYLMEAAGHLLITSQDANGNSWDTSYTYTYSTPFDQSATYSEVLKPSVSGYRYKINKVQLTLGYLEFEQQYGNWTTVIHFNSLFFFQFWSKFSYLVNDALVVSNYLTDAVLATGSIRKFFGGHTNSPHNTPSVSDDQLNQILPWGSTDFSAGDYPIGFAVQTLDPQLLNFGVSSYYASVSTTDFKVQLGSATYTRKSYPSAYLYTGNPNFCPVVLQTPQHIKQSSYIKKLEGGQSFSRASALSRNFTGDVPGIYSTYRNTYLGEFLSVLISGGAKAGEQVTLPTFGGQYPVPAKLEAQRVNLAPVWSKSGVTSTKSLYAVVTCTLQTNDFLPAPVKDMWLWELAAPSETQYPLLSTAPQNPNPPLSTQQCYSTSGWTNAVLSASTTPFPDSSALTKHSLWPTVVPSPWADANTVRYKGYYLYDGVTPVNASNHGYLSSGDIYRPFNFAVYRWDNYPVTQAQYTFSGWQEDTPTVDTLATHGLHVTA